MKEKSTKHKYRTFNSVADLLKAQDDIKGEYKDLEDNAIGNMFDPMSIALNVLPTAFRLFRPSKKKQRVHKQNKQYNELQNAINQIGANALETNISPPKKQLNILHPSKNDSFGKKVLASLIRWQTVELAIWGTGKLIKKYKDKKGSLAR